MQNYEIKKRVMCWPSTILGIVTIAYALFEISQAVPGTLVWIEKNMMIFLIGRLLQIGCGIVFVCSKL